MSYFQHHSTPEPQILCIKREFDSVPIEKMKINYSVPNFNLTDFPLSDRDFNAVLKLHPRAKEVQVLKLKNNAGISRIPDNIVDYTNLIELDLHGNNIEELPWALYSIKDTLQNLDLSQNAVKHIPRLIGSLVSLCELDLSHNNIPDLPADILNLTNLETLHMKGNPVTSPPADVCDQGKEAIFKALQERATLRHNVWSGTKLYIDSQYSERPKSLQNICYDEILDYGIGYSELPPKLIQHTNSMKENSINLAKCSHCLKFYSSKEKFDRHACR